MAFLKAQLDDWKPVSRLAGIAWSCAYMLFLFYTAFDGSGLLFPDNVNLIIHEGGHFFFSWFGRTIMILGGTLGELIVPLLCAVYFFIQREVLGISFSSFWFFEKFPYTGTYMADARAGVLPLVGAGDEPEHDLGTLFSQWGIITQDQNIGATVKSLGWVGMIGTVAWLAYRIFLAPQTPSRELFAEPGELN